MITIVDAMKARYLAIKGIEKRTIEKPFTYEFEKRNKNLQTNKSTSVLYHVLPNILTLFSLFVYIMSIFIDFRLLFSW